MQNNKNQSFRAERHLGVCPTLNFANYSDNTTHMPLHQSCKFCTVQIRLCKDTRLKHFLKKSLWKLVVGSELRADIEKVGLVSGA